MKLLKQIIQNFPVLLKRNHLKHTWIVLFVHKSTNNQNTKASFWLSYIPQEQKPFLGISPAWGKPSPYVLTIQTCRATFQQCLAVRNFHTSWWKLKQHLVRLSFILRQIPVQRCSVLWLRLKLSPTLLKCQNKQSHSFAIARHLSSRTHGHRLHVQEQAG